MKDLIRYNSKVQKDFTAARNHQRELKLHRSKAKHWYNIMKTPHSPKSVSYCFDLEQVRYIPHLTVCEIFYKRQLAYCFCVTDYKMKQTSKPFFYCWLETEGKRGSEEIASVLIEYLEEKLPTWRPEITAVRLFCDGCGGQNKNRHVIHALTFWLSEAEFRNEKLKKIILFFPVRGHSYLSCDRVIRTC